MLKFRPVQYVPSVFACAALLSMATTASAQVAAEAAAGAKVAVGGSCGTDPNKKCVPADVVVYAPFDIRVGRWDLEGPNREYDPLQATLGINPDITVHAMGLTSRTIIIANLGGGNSGFEWNIGGIWMFGGRLSFGQGKEGGLFARIGLDTHLGGNSDYYMSHLSLPRFELGYQLIKTDKMFLELAGRTGLTLTGRHEVLDRTRDLGFSYEGGGTATLQMKFLRLYVDAVRIFEEKNRPETPVDRAQADLCGILKRFSLCFTASANRGDVWTNGRAEETHADFIGGKLQATEAQIMRDEF